MNRFHFGHVEQYLFQTNAKITQINTNSTIKIDWIPVYSTLILPIITVDDIIMYKDYKQTRFYSLPIEVQKKLQTFYKDVQSFYKLNSKLISAYLTLFYLNNQPGLYEKEYIACIPSKQESTLVRVFSTFCVQKEKEIQSTTLPLIDCWRFIDKNDWISVFNPRNKMKYIDICLFFINRCTKSVYTEYITVLHMLSEEECKYISALGEKCVDYIQTKYSEPTCLQEEEKYNDTTCLQEEELDEATRLCIENLLLDDVDVDTYTPVKEQVTMRLNDEEPFSPDLHSLTVPQLREMCKYYNIKPIPKLKAECIAKLREIL